MPGTNTMTRITTLRSDALTCPSCVAKIERGVARMDGVRTVRVAFASGRIDIDHDDRVAPTALLEALARLGYDARVAEF